MLHKVKQLTIHAIDALAALQAQVVESLPDPEVYVAASREELCRALQEELVLGICDGDTLVAAAICIRNRSCSGNLGQKCGFAPKDCYTFDAVFVHPTYRGRGLQRELICAAQEKAGEEGALTMWCTVSPNNPYSYRNFTQMGFAAYKTGVFLYGGRVRDILKMKL